MKGSPNLWLPLFVVAILAILPLGGWSALPSAAEAPGGEPETNSVTVLADADATIKYGSPDGNFGGADAALDLQYAGGRATSCILLHFNLSASLPSGTIIDSAQLQVRLNSGTGVSPITVGAYTVMENWGEYSVTWNTGPEYADPYAEAQVGTTQGWSTWDVTAIARAWQAGRNYGLELRGLESGADWYRTFRNRHLGEAEPRLVVIYSYTETAPPSNPTSFTADHTANQWSKNATISGHWNGASDGAGSGVYGYSIAWSASPTTVPDAVADTTTNQITHLLADGSWYLHVRTVDLAGNWNTSASHFGPYKIDTTLPTDPTISSTSHTPGAWSKNPSVLASWSGASDGAGSGLAGYSILWDAAASTLPDTTVDTTGGTASSSRPDGATYFHLRTKDVAGNWTSTVHFGPLKIDTTPPTNPTSFTANHTVNQWSNNASISGHWNDASDGSGSGVYGYSIEWSTSPTTVPDPVVDTTTNQGTRQLADGLWYLHVRTRDGAGNWNTGAVDFGPYKIDTTPPEDPLITSSSHAALLWSNNPTVVVSWYGASDSAGSGLAGYSILWDAAASTVPDTTVDTSGSTASSLRPDGSTYFHLRTKDVAGNWSAAVHYGPVGIDTQPPQPIVNLEVVPTSYAGVRLTWNAPADAASGVEQYDARFSTAPINVSNWASASPLTSLPQPGAPGAPQQVGRTGLKNGDTWYFAIRSRDRVNNWSAISNVRNILDLGLRPDFYGYQFGNYGDTQPGDLTAEDLARMLGHNQVCHPFPADSCVPYPYVPDVLSAILKAAGGGHCNGFTATSLRFFRQVGDPPSTYQAGATKPHDLLKPNARRHLMYYWTKQLYEPLDSVRNASYGASAAQNVTKLQTAFSGYQLDPLDMHIWHTDAGGTAGHSILPYALENRGSGVWRVWVYDNNAPDAMTSFAEINTSTNSWSYGGWGGVCGSNGNSMGLVPMSTYGLTPDVAAAAATDDAALVAPEAGTAGIWLAGGTGHLLVIDPQGRRIGYLGTERVNEIPGASADDILGGLGTPIEPIYTVPADQGYRILLTGTTATAGDPVMVLHHANRDAASVEGVPLTTASRGELTVAAGGASLTYRAGRAAGVAAAEPAAIEQPTLTLALTGATEGYRLRIVGADVAVGQTVGLRADLAAGRVTLDGSQAGSGSCDLVIERSSSAGVRHFVHHNVPVAAGDTLLALFGAWDGQGAITVQVDHGSNGTVDDTWTLDNQMSKNYLPIVTRAR